MPTDQSYREMLLTQGKVAIVDAQDFEWASQWKWYAKLKPNGSFYAARNQTVGIKRQITIELHRALMGVSKGDKRRVDHENHDTLDDRRVNLRVCTNTQNCQNARTKRNSKSGIKGVGFHSSTGKWRAKIQINGKRISLGLRSTPEEAAELYRLAAEKHFGEFACVESRL